MDGNTLICYFQATQMSKTPPTTDPGEKYFMYMGSAIQEATKGLEEGGIPIGACLVHNPTGIILGTGRNRRVQMNSATRHGETDCLERFVRELI